MLYAGTGVGMRRAAALPRRRAGGAGGNHGQEEAGQSVRAYDLIRSRRSIREFEPRPVAADVVRRCIEAATYAPNLRLTQPWRFVVLRGGPLNALADAATAFELRVEPLPGLSAAAPLRGAALAIAVLQTPAPDPATGAADRLAIGAAVQNLMLCAWDEDVGALWIGGPLLGDAAVRAVCGVATDRDLAAVIALGHASAVPPLPRRLRAEALTRTLE